MEQPRILDSSGRVASRRKRRLKTPPVEEACKRVLDAFSTGCGSSMLVGKPRLGKTFAARWICQTIQELLGPVYWYEVSFEKGTYATENGFFSLLLKSIDHQYQKCRKAREFRDRIGEFLIERASESPLGTIILLLDEAQNLSEIHWTWLAEISNSIDKVGLSLFTLSTGQKSLYVQRNTFRELQTEQDGEFIIGRFFLDMCDFRGLRTENDLKLTLHEYDISPFGPDDRILWLEAALPTAYISGWRLEGLTGLIWEAYCDIWHRAGRKDIVEIPMTYFDLLVRQILGTPERFNISEPGIGLKETVELVQRTQFIKSI